MVVGDTLRNLRIWTRFHLQHRRWTRGVRSNRYRLCSGALPTWDSSQGAVVMHRFPRHDCAVPPGISVVKHPLTLLTARVGAIP